MISTQVGKIESDSEKEEKAKFASRKSGTRIAEVEKRPVVARLKADEAEWKKRDVHTRHETATLEIGKAVAWHYAPVGKPGELWFRFGVIVDIHGGKLKEDKAGKNSNPDVNVTLRAFDPPLRYPLNAVWKSTSASGGLLNGVASMASRSTRRFSTNAPQKYDFHTG